MGALVEFMDIEVHPDAMAIMDSFGPEMEFFQNIATNTCGDGWNHCRAQEATVVDGVDPDFVDIPIPDINGPDDAAGPGGEIDGNRLRRLLKDLSNTHR